MNAVSFKHQHKYEVRKDTVSMTTDKIEQDETELEEQGKRKKKSEEERKD